MTFPHAAQVRQFAAAEYAKSGVHLHAGFTPVSVTKQDGSLSLKMKNAAGEEIVIDGANHVLAATGTGVRKERGDCFVDASPTKGSCNVVTVD